MVTKLVPVVFDPDAECPIWELFLERILPDPSVRRFAQRALGWCLTGDVSEQNGERKGRPRGVGGGAVV